MRILIILSLLLVCASAQAADLSVRFSGIESPRGNIRVSVYASEAAYKASSASAKLSIPADGRPLAVFKGLSAGQYAVIAYQDLNLNAKLDRADNGMPLEPYGFSQNPSSRFGQPPFSATVVTVGTEDSSIEIMLE